MIRRNQSSSSPPGPAYSSPPVSPTVTQVSSRSPTPSPPEIHDPPRDAARRSPSPHRSPTPSDHASKMGSRLAQTSTHEPDQQQQQQQQHHERPAPQPAPRPQMHPSVSAPAGRLPRLLPADLSQYTDGAFPSDIVSTSSTSLAELAHLIRLQSYQEQRRCHARVRLHRSLVANALSARLVHCGELVHRTLVDHFRSDDKKGFAQLYNALHDVRNSCDATRRYALLEPDLEFGKAKTQKNERVNSFSTFMHEIPTKTRDDLLEFLSELRTNPDFLATRITSLSQQELASLTTFRQALDPIDSVMALQARGKPVPSAQKSQALSGSSAVERLLSFQRHDPLSALIYTIFANSSGPDSAEDLRRTDIWATTCARLITEGKPGSDKFIKSVLDAWAGMREWPGKINLELYLMEVLQDGQFLLEKTEEPARQRGQPETRSTKDTIAADEFYDRSVLRLFEVIDDEPSAGGIPEGILEIGMAILKKLEDSRKHRTAAQTFIVSRWFFSTYLLNAIIHPESQGIMTGHHITEHARQKILKEIAIRAQKQVLDMTYNWKQAVPILPEIRHHIDNIMNRFKTRSHSKPVLLPAKAITSPRETVEVQPFVVMCPSDIITIVNSLYPERRPSSSHTEDGHHRGLASGASSISGVSLPFRNPSISGDASSILSQSAASSMTSDTTSREPLLEPHVGPVESHHPLTTGDNYPGHESKVEPTEEYGRKIRSTCSEMTRVLGLDATGSCHPCAEKWSVLYVSSGGKELRTRMRKDTESEEEPDEDSTESESDDEGVNDRMELESDYHSIKVAIVKLVEEYEIPKELAPESESKGFSNRTSAIRREARPMGPNRAASAPLGDRNPYHSASQSQLSTMFASQRGTPPSRMRAHGRTNSNADLKDSGPEKPSVLIIMLEAAMNQCQARSDFVNAHLYFKTLQYLRKIQSPSLTRNGYAALLNYFGRGPRESLAKSSSAIEEFEAWFVWLKQSQERHDEAIEDMMAGMKTLRDKMWYITDVRNSAGYEEAKNVALALKIMGQPTKTPDGKPVQTHRPRNPSKVANNFLLKTEAQVLDLMAAPTDHGGPNKLADEQSDMTLRWLKQYAIESSFCKGEERIHRFCLEIDKCVNKLVGDGILDGPVLWSSELYRRDKEVLDTGRQKGDLFLTGVGTLSIAGDEEYESHPGKSSLRSLDFAQRPSNSSLRSVHRNGSQQSFDSGKWSGSRPIDLMDSQDYFGGSSPVLSIDSSNTFWSPFQTQAASSPTSATSIRPGSSRGTVMLKQSATVNEDKRRFLLDLKQTLTGLLLSDLGTIVFSSGSETDAWFSGDLGEECIARKEEEEKRRKRAARKKSMRNLRSAAKEQRGPGSEHHSSTEHSSSGTDATARSSAISAKKAGLLEFPFNSAFRRLLHKFATHPNPFSKLHALYELELLIIASLSSRTGRSYSRRETLPTVPQSPTLGSVPEYSSREATANHVQAQNLEEAIANCEGRRSHSMMNGDEAASASYRNGARSPPGPPSTDMIVDVLTGLFRDAEIRPKTLFRDLQYIASFVPAQMLDKTARGKAFWDAGLAALGLKQDICRIMVEIADDIVALNTQNRSAALQHAANSSSGASEKAGVTSATVAPSPDDPLNKFTMEDAARMLIITAKEGDAVAERELAIFYLTHPDLLPRTTLPLTKPTEVFKAELLQRDRKREDPARSDPITMCVAQHWMEMSKRGGDQLATKYLRARDEMERIP